MDGAVAGPASSEILGTPHYKAAYTATNIILWKNDIIAMHSPCKDRQPILLHLNAFLLSASKHVQTPRLGISSLGHDVAIVQRGRALLIKAHCLQSEA